MPLKPVFTVEVDDAQFKKFKSLFDKYQDALKTLPKNWKAVAGEATAAGAATATITGSLEDQVKLILKQMGYASKIKESSKIAASSWGTIFSKAHEVDKALAHGTMRMLKWGAITTGVLGGLGALGLVGSLFGLDRLAANVTGLRRTSMGLGLPIGGYQAAQANLSRLIDPSSLLQGAATAKYDITSPAFTAMLAAGVNPSTLKYGNTGDIAAEFLGHLPSRFAHTQKGLWGALAGPQGYNYTQVMPMNDIIAYLNASERERKEIRDKTRADSKSLNINDDAAKKWADFTTQMDRASKQIEATFMTALAPLADPLSGLSTDVVNLVNDFGKSGTLKGWIDDLGGGINELAGFIKSKDFKDDLDYYFDKVKKVGKEIWQFVSSFSLITPTYAEGAPSSADIGKGGDLYQPGDVLLPGGRWYRPGSGMMGQPGGGNGAPADISTTVSYKGIAPEQRALLDVIASGESGKGGDYNIVYGGGHFSDYSHHPGTTAAGRYQDIPSTWAKLQRKYLLPDFSPKSQDIGNLHLAENDYRAATGRDLWSDVKAGNWDQIKSGLQGTWVSWAGFSPEKLKQAYARALQRETLPDVVTPLSGGYGDNPGSPRLPYKDYPHNGTSTYIPQDTWMLRMPTVTIRNSTGNNPVTAHAQLSSPTEAYSP